MYWPESAEVLCEEEDEQRKRKRPGPISCLGHNGEVLYLEGGSRRFRQRLIDEATRQKVLAELKTDLPPLLFLPFLSPSLD